MRLFFPSQRTLPLRIPHGRFFWLKMCGATVVVLGFCTLAFYEVRTSALEAHLLSWYGRKINFEMQPDANVNIRFPKFGPYNDRLGYSYMSFFIKALRSDDFAVAAQMRASSAYNHLVRHGFYPIYHAKTVAGLTLYDRSGDTVYKASYPVHVFETVDEIPPLLANTLLYIENRDLLKEGSKTRNPVIEWGRFFYALLGHALHSVVHSFNPGGGSTLATQTEKFRFSPQGQTGSGLEKIRQIASASMRVYLDGPDTRKARYDILLDYLNSTPLSARPGFGEINSIGDGLWAWFGYDLKDTSAALRLEENDASSLEHKAEMYRATLGLILAQRRPSYYLQTNRPALDDLTNATLERLQEAHVISPALASATRSARLQFLIEPPPAPEPPYIEKKAVNALRGHLLNLLGLKKLYEVDRLDITAHTTLDDTAQKKLVEFLKKMNDRDFLQSIGLYGFRLLKAENDPGKIKWSVVLYERGRDSNKIRLQADNIDEPFDMNEGMKLDLGSTAKLRTLVTYLEIVAELHRRYAGLSSEDLQDFAIDAPDALTEWATAWLSTHPKADLESLLRASLERTYSGNNSEIFFTGGGQHVFHNFEHDEDYEVMDLHEAFRRSVNLVFVRVMRDIVNYTIAQEAQSKDELLSDSDQPGRQSYLERFADKEASQFLSRYINDLDNMATDQRLDELVGHGHKSTVSRILLYRSIYPDSDFSVFRAYLNDHPLRTPCPEAQLNRLFRENPASRYNLADRAYLTGVNPMELWLVAYWRDHPHASRHELIDVSRSVRLESYAWLFSPRVKHAQDTRIRIMLEEDAFAHIQKRWARLGYPFDHLVPSYATAIGSSADRPGALSELVGIILADGRKLPVERFESIELGTGTPYQTLLKQDESIPAKQVLDPVIARVMREVMREVVDNGTAKRVKDVYHDQQGKVLPVGGKTGTGDQRYDEVGAGGHVISSRVVNRTGTFAFYIGDRFFGAITAHVAGQDAEDYVFTSALSAQMLRALAPIFTPVVNGASPLTVDTPLVEPNQPLPP